MDCYLSKAEEGFDGRFVVVSHISGNEGNKLGRLPLHSENLATVMTDIVKIAIARLEGESSPRKHAQSSLGILDYGENRISRADDTMHSQKLRGYDENINWKFRAVDTS